MMEVENTRGNYASYTYVRRMAFADDGGEEHASKLLQLYIRSPHGGSEWPGGVEHADGSSDRGTPFRGVGSFLVEVNGRWSFLTS